MFLSRCYYRKMLFDKHVQIQQLDKKDVPIPDSIGALATDLPLDVPIIKEKTAKEKDILLSEEEEDDLIWINGWMRKTFHPKKLNVK